MTRIFTFILQLSILSSSKFNFGPKIAIFSQNRPKKAKFVTNTVSLKPHDTWRWLTPNFDQNIHIYILQISIVSSSKLNFSPKIAIFSHHRPKMAKFMTNTVSPKPHDTWRWLTPHFDQNIHIYTATFNIELIKVQFRPQNSHF